jgi:hypothetical protein
MSGGDAERGRGADVARPKTVYKTKKRKGRELLRVVMDAPTLNSGSRFSRSRSTV